MRRDREQDLAAAEVVFLAAEEAADDRQLAEARDYAVLEIARLTGIDPEDLGVSTTSRTYQPVTDKRQDRINDTLSPYMLAITSRLAMNDVTRRGKTVEFDLAGFLRADPRTRADVNAVLEARGVIDVDEWRAAEDAVTELPVGPRVGDTVRRLFGIVGTVESIGRFYLHVRMDKSGRTVRVVPENVKEISA